jgi:putative flippase GtrA
MEETSHRRALPLYIGAGGIATASHYATAIVAVEWLRLPPLAATTAGFCIGAAVKYWLNYTAAFRSRAPHREATARFGIALVLFLALNAALFWLLQSRLGLHYLLAQVITTAALIPPGYVLHRQWVFRAC